MSDRSKGLQHPRAQRLGDLQGAQVHHAGRETCPPQQCQSRGTGRGCRRAPARPRAVRYAPCRRAGGRGDSSTQRRLMCIAVHAKPVSRCRCMPAPTLTQAGLPASIGGAHAHAPAGPRSWPSSAICRVLMTDSGYRGGGQAREQAGAHHEELLLVQPAAAVGGRRRWRHPAADRRQAAAAAEAAAAAAWRWQRSAPHRPTPVARLTATAALQQQLAVPVQQQEPELRRLGALEQGEDASQLSPRPVDLCFVFPLLHGCRRRSSSGCHARTAAGRLPSQLSMQVC